MGPDVTSGTRGSGQAASPPSGRARLLPSRKSTPREGAAPAKPQICTGPDETSPSQSAPSICAHPWSETQAANLYRLRWNFALPIHPWFQTETQRPSRLGCNCALTQKAALQTGMTDKVPATRITSRAKSHGIHATTDAGAPAASGSARTTKSARSENPELQEFYRTRVFSACILATD